MSRTACFILLVAVLAMPVLAFAESASDQPKGDLVSQLRTYEQEVAGLMKETDSITADYDAGKPVAKRVDTLVGEWEQVDFHEAVETHAIALYPPIWAALGGLKDAVGKPSAGAEVRQWRNRLAAALYEGVGALKLVAANENNPADDLNARSQPAASDKRPAVVVIKDNLQTALAHYRENDVGAATRQVHQAYMQRFEGIEGDLIEQDADLVTQLETDFNATLPQLMKKGATIDKVSAKIDAMNTDLDKAQTLLDRADKQHSEVF